MYPSARMKRLLLLLLLVPSLHAAQIRLGEDVVPTAEAVALTTDPRSDAYGGSVRIDLVVRKATNTVRFHAQDLTITALKLTRDEGPIAVTHGAGEEDTVIVSAAEPLQPGSYVLSVDFTNQYNRKAVGLYKMTTKDGEPYLFTQLEAIDARRAFPCWDEPGFKIPYQLTVTIPAQYDAVSNTPVASETKTPAAKTIRFARTKPLPSYLIALAVGQFDYTPIPNLSVPGRVVSPKGQGRLATTAAEYTPPILAALEKYFGSKYPFEKVDLIAVPEYWAGAMENPGAITYRDTVLLVDPATATPTQKQNLARITAHELAHMWFGDLVTMEWWDDFWLNESFADWMGDKITDQVFPQYEHLIGELAEVQFTMNQDARATTDAIRKRDMTPLDAMRNVGLVYNKGKSVLSMFESWIGPDKFRQGVLAYLESNAWGNGNSSEFFASLAKSAPAGTAAAMDTFIAQPGIPLISIEPAGTNGLRLTQTRFSTGKAVAETWKVPVTIRYSDGAKVRSAAVLLDTPSKMVQLEGERIAWVFPHAHATGYYRWQMPADAMTALAAHATEVLEPAERLSFIGNAGALFRAGMLHGDAYLDLLGHFANDPEPHVLGVLLDALEQVRSTFDTAENRARFTAYVRRTLGPGLDRIGLNVKPGESQSITLLRPRLMMYLARHGNDERVWQFANETLPKYLKDATVIDPTLSGVVLGLAAARGDEELLEEYRKRFENATLPAERARYLTAMSRFEDPALRKKVRDYAVTGPVRPQELYPLLGDAETVEQRDELYRWATENYEGIAKKIPPAFMSRMPALAGGCEPQRIERAREFFATHQVEGTERQLARVTEQVNECAALRNREMEAVTRFLSAP